ncbi:hypothetical protein IFM89_035113 [Coptis chinensis]|uniref:Uncharacterized protein n=1 Tax=Coptis chinensis TaxID=261450 RepID=A0A835MB20_9MAGN|nr:hypothetical protein IFM89_035113 [Coptis chinensis]
MAVTLWLAQKGEIDAKSLARCSTLTNFGSNRSQPYDQPNSNNGSNRNQWIHGTRFEDADIKSTPFQPYNEVFGLQRFRECELTGYNVVMLIHPLEVAIYWTQIFLVYLYTDDEPLLLAVAGEVESVGFNVDSHSTRDSEIAR